MKKAIIILLLIFPLIATIYSIRASQREPSTNENQPTCDTSNFLKGNRYLLTSFYNNEDRGEEKCKKLILANSKKDHDRNFIYGIFIEFTDSLHYASYNVEWCGTSCFFRTDGRYYLSSSDELTLIVDSTTYRRLCYDTPTEYGDGKKDIYKITRLNNDSTIQLKQY